MDKSKPQYPPILYQGSAIIVLPYTSQRRKRWCGIVLHDGQQTRVAWHDKRAWHLRKNAVRAGKLTVRHLIEDALLKLARKVNH